MKKIIDFWSAKIQNIFHLMWIFHCLQIWGNVRRSSIHVRLERAFGANFVPLKSKIEFCRFVNCMRYAQLNQNYWLLISPLPLTRHNGHPIRSLLCVNDIHYSSCQCEQNTHTKREKTEYCLVVHNKYTRYAMLWFRFRSHSHSSLWVISVVLKITKQCILRTSIVKDRVVRLREIIAKKVIERNVHCFVYLFIRRIKLLLFKSSDNHYQIWWCKWHKCSAKSWKLFKFLPNNRSRYCWRCEFNNGMKLACVLCAKYTVHFGAQHYNAKSNDMSL